MARYPQKHIEIPQIHIAVLAIDTIGRLPVTLEGNRGALTAICLHTLYVFVILMEEESAKNVVQDYLSGILFHKGRGVVILSNNSTELKKTELSMEHVTNWN